MLPAGKREGIDGSFITSVGDSSVHSGSHQTGLSFVSLFFIIFLLL